MKQTFEQKVKSMTASEIILAMVEGLVDPVTEISFSTFGRVNKGVCYGCAATNAISKIGGYNISDLIRNLDKDNYINLVYLTHTMFVGRFENAIDWLRRGDLYIYNVKAHDFAKISNPLDIRLPFLENDYTYEDLIPYIKLAMSQPDYSIKPSKT